MKTSPLDLYEKAPTVFWSATPSGVVLHNYATSGVVELNATELLVWERLDGVHSLKSIEHIIAARGSGEPAEVVSRVFHLLATGGFVVRRYP